MSVVRITEFHGIGNQIDQNLDQPVAVGTNPGQAAGKVQIQAHALGLGQGGCRGHGGLHDRPQVKRDHVPFQIAGFHLRKVQKLVDQARQTLRFSDHDTVETVAFRPAQGRVVGQDFPRRAD